MLEGRHEFNESKVAKLKNKKNRVLVPHCVLEMDCKTISQIVRALVHIGSSSFACMVRQ